MTKELEMIITACDDGVYVSYMPKINGKHYGEGFLNRRFDGVEFTVTYRSSEQTVSEKNDV